MFGSVFILLVSFFSTQKHADTSTTFLYSLWRQRCCLWGWSTHAGTYQQSSGGTLSSSACSASRLPCWTLPTVIPWVTFHSISAKASEEERAKLNLKFFFLCPIQSIIKKTVSSESLFFYLRFSLVSSKGPLPTFDEIIWSSPPNEVLAELTSSFLYD